MLLHLLLVPHVTCEHGELIHVSRQARNEGGAAVAPSSRSEAKACHAKGAGHDHCDTLAVRHRISEVGPAVPSAMLSWIEPVTVSGERSEVRAVPLLSLAPKSSPPA